MRLSQVEFLLHFLFYPCDMQKSVPVGEICMQCKRCQLSVQSVSTLSDVLCVLLQRAKHFIHPTRRSGVSLAVKHLNLNSFFKMTLSRMHASEIEEATCHRFWTAVLPISTQEKAA